MVPGVSYRGFFPPVARGQSYDALVVWAFCCVVFRIFSHQPILENLRSRRIYRTCYRTDNLLVWVELVAGSFARSPHGVGESGDERPYRQPSRRRRIVFVGIDLVMESAIKAI